MFDIGFWEIIFIGVIALVVVGPDEFPVLIRNIGTGIGKTKRFFSSVKSDLDYEIDRANEIKRLIAEEAKISEMHDTLAAEMTNAVAVSSSNNIKSKQTEHGDEAEEAETDSRSAQSIGDRRPDKRPS